MQLNSLKQNISKNIIDSQLPIDAVYFVLKDIYREIEQLYFLELQKLEQKENLNNIKQNKKSDN